MADLMIPIEFGLSEERKMMLDMLKKFKEKECPKDKIGEWDEANHFPVDVWKKLGDEGILGACFPEEFGGTGGNIIDETLITEEISNSFSAMGLAYLTGVASAVCRFCITEPMSRKRITCLSLLRVTGILPCH